MQRDDQQNPLNSDILSDELQKSATENQHKTDGLDNLPEQDSGFSLNFSKRNPAELASGSTAQNLDFITDSASKSVESDENSSDFITDAAKRPEGNSADGKKGKTPLKERAINCLKSLPKRWFITAFSGMAVGLFCTLIAGTILINLALIFKDWAPVIYDFLTGAGKAAQLMMGAGIGAGIASQLKAPKMVVAAAAAAGFIGAFAGVLDAGGIDPILAGRPYFQNPINSYICALAATELGILVSGKTKLDILVVPLTCLLGGAILAATLGGPVDKFVELLGSGIDAAAKSQGFLTSVIVSVAMGLALTLPTSSAAIGVSVGLSGLAAGAAVAGCCSHMVGFAVASFRENRFSGLVSQGLGTSMLQIPNVMRRPQILVPAVVASAVCGPIATLVFDLVCNPAGSGMGTAGLVGIITTVSESLSAGVATWKVVVGVLVSLLVLPAVIAFGVSELMRKLGWIKHGDMLIKD